MTPTAISGYDLLSFVHILLFVYWLGGDLGVFYTANYVARPDLAKPERLRFLELLMKVDMYPRMALIAMLPVGFHLAATIGAVRLASVELALLWLAAALWFALMWAVHLKAGPAWLKPLDLAVRWAVLATLFALGAAGLIVDWPTDRAWLALKFLLFAAVIALGLTLRRAVVVWVQGFGQLDADPETGNRLIVDGRRRAAKLALTLWACLILMAFLGVVKPVI